MKELFKKIWTFSIGLDAANITGSSYLDFRMRCFFKGDIQNLHFLTIPMREQHTGEYQFRIVVTLLEDVLAPNWGHQLIGIAIDGASTMTGCIKGTATHLSFSYLPHLVWKTPDGSCNETSLQQILR